MKHPYTCEAGTPVALAICCKWDALPMWKVFVAMACDFWRLWYGDSEGISETHYSFLSLKPRPPAVAFPNNAQCRGVVSAQRWCQQRPHVCSVGLWPKATLSNSNGFVIQNLLVVPTASWAALLVPQVGLQCPGNKTLAACLTHLATLLIIPLDTRQLPRSAWE